MHQLIGIALVVALTLAVMPAPGAAGLAALAADDANSLFPAAAVAVPNFISYRDRSRVADATNSSAHNHPSRPANTAEPADDNEPTGFLVPHPVGSAYDIGA
jgi:hypothetical protein